MDGILPPPMASQSSTVVYVRRGKSRNTLSGKYHSIKTINFSDWFCKRTGAYVLVTFTMAHKRVEASRLACARRGARLCTKLQANRVGDKTVELIVVVEAIFPATNVVLFYSGDSIPPRSS